MRILGLEIRGRRIVFLETYRTPLMMFVLRPRMLSPHTYSVPFFSRKTGEAVETSVTLKQHSNKWLAPSVTLAERLFKRIPQTLAGLLDNLVCALPWALPLLAFLELHRLHYDPGGHANIMSGDVEITLEKYSFLLNGFRE